MAIFPVRNLGKFGVLTDPDAYDLATQAFSFAKNVRFRNGKVSRGPVFRKIDTVATTSPPRFVVSTSEATGIDKLYIAFLDGSISEFASGTETVLDIAGYTPLDADVPYTAVRMANVFYMNREDRVPWAFLPGASDFVELANWTSTNRAGLIRSCAGALVALNITKSGVQHPTMIKTSNFPTSGIVPTSWDETDPATLSTENVLAEMQGVIVDAQSLGSNLIIYGASEAWLMRFDGSQNVYAYDKLPFSRGAASANCSIEISGTHYVFGPDDIWKHDGLTDVSICEGRTREFIFNNINLSKKHLFFVAHNPKLKEIHFHYVSGDGFTAFDGGTGCNRAAVYNYLNDTWTFDDLPFVFSATATQYNTSQTYAESTATYETIGGTYLDQDDGTKQTLTYIGETSVPHSLTAGLYALDAFGAGSNIASPVDVNATAGAYLERDGIDLDEVGAELTGYKICHSIIPQGRLGTDAADLEFAFGAADYFNEVPTFTDYQTYDGGELYKLDFGQSGRYLSMKINFPDYKEMSLSGFDLDLDVLGER